MMMIAADAARMHGFLYNGGCIGPSEAYTNGGGCVGSSWA